VGAGAREPVELEGMHIRTARHGHLTVLQSARERDRRWNAQTCCHALEKGHQEACAVGAAARV
jgi:hypothetical protein